MICSYCGTDLPAGAMFCGECGRPVIARTEGKARSRASSVSPASSRWPSSVAEHVPRAEDAVAAPPPSKTAARSRSSAAAGHALVEPPRAADAVFAEPPPAAVVPASSGEPGPETPTEDSLVAARLPIVAELPAPDAPSVESAPAAASVEPDVEPVVEPDVEPVEFASPVAEASQEPVAEPEPIALVEPAPYAEQFRPDAVIEAGSWPPPPLPEPAAGVEPAPAPRPAPAQPDVVMDVVVVEGAMEACAQCGAPLAASDIFCGVCGFVRKPVAPGSERPRDTVAYDPFPWGLPRQEDAIASAEAPPAPGYDDDSDVEKTRIVEHNGRGERFVLQFSTGESVSVSGTGLIGRNPVAEPGEYFDSLVTIVDPGKSVSKTHLEFGQDAGAFWVSDRYSANGTMLREPDRPARRADAGKRYRVVRGTRVDIGEQFFIVS